MDLLLRSFAVLQSKSAVRIRFSYRAFFVKSSFYKISVIAVLDAFSRFIRIYFLYIFITGRVTLRHIIPALTVRAACCGVILVCLAIPWWKFVGIM